MRSHTIILFLSVVASFCLVPQTNAQVLVLKGDIYDGNIGPLGPGVYHCDNIRVPAGKTLTIRTANLKFFDNRSLTVDGVIDSTQGVYCTSIHDDSIGGDTNGNGGGTVPAAGDWIGVRFGLQAGSSVFNAAVRYAGRGGSPGIRVRSPGMVLGMFRSVVADIGGVGIDLGSAYPIINKTLIANCGGVAMVGEFPFLERVVGSSAFGCAGGNFILRKKSLTMGWPQGVTTLTIDRRHTLNNSGVLVIDQEVGIPFGKKLSLANGVDVKFSSNGGLLARGELELIGSSSDPIVLTSLTDDTLGGDTNLDGSATSPTPGSWRSIRCDRATGKVKVEDGEIRYAGGSLSFGGAMVIANGQCDVSDTLFRDCKGFGIGHSTGTSSTNYSTIRGCSFRDLSGPSLNQVPLDILPDCYDNVTLGTTPRHVLVESILRRNTEVDRDNIPNGISHLTASISVDSGQRLTIHAGLWFKFDASRSIGARNGTLELLGTAAAPIKLTTIHDDSVAGDTNGNGTATIPIPGAWTGVILSGSTPSRIEHTNIRYAKTGISCQSDQTSIQAVRVAFPRTGLWLYKLKGSLDNALVVGATTDGIRLSNAAFSVYHATVADCAGYGFSVPSGSTFLGTIRSSIAWNNSLGNFQGIQSKSVIASCGGFAQINNNIMADPLFIDPENLTIAPNSPCVNTGEWSTATFVGTDIDGRSRICDHDFSGSLLPDMGAHEQAAGIIQWNLPLPKMGDLLEFTVRPTDSRNHGFVGIILGLDNGSIYAPTLGVLNAGIFPLFTVGSGTSGQKIGLAIPNDPNLRGIRLATQGILLPTRLPGQGSLTNVYRFRIRG